MSCESHFFLTLQNKDTESDLRRLVGFSYNLFTDEFAQIMQRITLFCQKCRADPAMFCPAVPFVLETCKLVDVLHTTTVNHWDKLQLEMQDIRVAEVLQGVVPWAQNYTLNATLATDKIRTFLQHSIEDLDFVIRHGQAPAHNKHLLFQVELASLAQLTQQKKTALGSLRTSVVAVVVIGLMLTLCFVAGCSYVGSKLEAFYHGALLMLMAQLAAPLLGITIFQAILFHRASGQIGLLTNALLSMTNQVREISESIDAVAISALNAAAVQ